MRGDGERRARFRRSWDQARWWRRVRGERRRTDARRPSALMPRLVDTPFDAFARRTRADIGADQLPRLHPAVPGPPPRPAASGRAFAGDHPPTDRPRVAARPRLAVRRPVAACRWQSGRRSFVQRLLQCKLAACRSDIRTALIETKASLSTGIDDKGILGVTIAGYWIPHMMAGFDVR